MLHSFPTRRSSDLAVAAAVLCTLLADPKAGRLDALAIEHGLLLAPHLDVVLEPLGETMGLLIEACLSLQVLGPAEMREALAKFVRANGKPQGTGPAPAAAAAAPAPRAPRPLPAAVDKLLGAVKALWSPPAGLKKINEMLEVPGTPVDRISGEIERDPPLAAEILRVVNVLSGAGAASVKRVIVMLGYPALRRILGPSALLARLAQPPPPAPFDHRAFWAHSLRVAHAAQLVSRAARLGEPEEHFLAGFLRDIGRLVVARVLPARYKAVLEATARGAPLDEAEKAALGTGHAEIGGCVAERWEFPPGAAEAARHHHDPPAALEDLELPRKAAVVAALCAIMKETSRPADWLPLLRLPENRLSEIRLQAARLSEDSLHAYGIAPP